jgi:hypothetical protein
VNRHPEQDWQAALSFDNEGDFLVSLRNPLMTLQQ